MPTQHVNPLFPSEEPQQIPADDGYILPRSVKRIDAAAVSKNVQAGANAAISMIRDKLARIYAEEPNAAQEEAKAAVARPRSIHQQFMYDLSHSGKSLVEVQTAWHSYYVALPDSEKHAVWQEFYAANDALHTGRSKPSETARPHVAPASLSQAYTQPQPAGPHQVVVSASPPPEPLPVGTVAQLRHRIRHKVSAGGKLKARHHFQSLGFGLAVGLVTLVVTLFGFFNEVIIAPFIQPSRTVSATPIIVDPSAVTASTTPEIIIPKINLEIPVDYSQTSDDENTIENALENGIVHYPSTVMPGQSGNAAFFGHSSNNIFNPGKYKFAFVLLHELQAGDTFYLTYNGKVYIYKVFETMVVDPTDVGVLDNVSGHPATATLITCDPPGTSLHRLVVVGDQISPDPTTDSSGTNTASTTLPTDYQLPDNGPNLFQRLWDSLF